MSGAAEVGRSGVGGEFLGRPPGVRSVGSVVTNQTKGHVGTRKRGVREASGKLAGRLHREPVREQIRGVVGWVYWQRRELESTRF
jgi:hypothetical protein